MAKIATSFVNCYKLTPQTSLPQLSSYTEELANKLSDGKTKEQARKARDQAKRRFQELGLSKEQADTLIPIRAPGRHVDERDPIKIIAQDIIKNNLLPEEINGIAYDLASSAPTTATKIPFITEEANQIQARKRILRGINGYDCPEFFYLEKVQKRLSECDTTKPPSMQNLIDVMIMLCMRSADVKNLRINRYKPSRESWYNPDYSLYCTGYAKNKGEVEEPRPFLSMEKNPIRARELLIWIQKSIPDKFPFLLKDKDGNTNVVPLNQFLSRHRIMLRKIGADHASRVHEGFDWFTGRKYDDEELQIYRAEIVTDAEDGWVRTTLRIKNLAERKGKSIVVPVYEFDRSEASLLRNNQSVRDQKIHTYIRACDVAK
ncbi:9941_t:CDS:2 [Paraglomus brasilianum]|uniref:9941_t:CDS:1 n=1 Tax=Paraglomus brasilianum TaxID=144538 RepID=A0A9N9C602_9GLOM|nr:9941_t:CDS:2 [Paraglomus brasilianum]